MLIIYIKYEYPFMFKFLSINWKIIYNIILLNFKGDNNQLGKEK